MTKDSKPRKLNDRQAGNRGGEGVKQARPKVMRFQTGKVRTVIHRTDTAAEDDDALNFLDFAG